MVLRNVIDEMKRILSSFGFWLAVGLALLILLTSEIYRDLDGTVYTVFSATHELEDEEVLLYDLNAQRFFYMQLTSCLPMYGPMLAALSFAKVLCEEQKYGVRRYLLFREGKRRYVLSKALSAILASGLCFLVIGVLFLAFMYWNYPMWTQISAESYAGWLEYQLPKTSGWATQLFAWFGEHAYCILTLMGCFVYGVFCGFIGFICTAFFSNIYLAVCIPFFFGYIYYSIVQSFDGRLLEGSISVETYNAIHSYVSPAGYIDFWRSKDYVVVNLVVLLAVWIMAIVTHLIYMKKTSDCGVSR